MPRQASTTTPKRKLTGEMIIGEIEAVTEPKRGTRSNSDAPRYEELVPKLHQIPAGSSLPLRGRWDINKVRAVIRTFPNRTDYKVRFDGEPGSAEECLRVFKYDPEPKQANAPMQAAA